MSQLHQLTPIFKQPCLLVSEDQQHSIAHLVLVQHFVELFSGIFDAVPVVAVNHVDQAVCALVVVAPQGANLVLASDIPDLRIATSAGYIRLAIFGSL